jgi:hypothetical protein
MFAVETSFDGAGKGGNMKGLSRYGGVAAVVVVIFGVGSYAAFAGGGGENPAGDTSKTHVKADMLIGYQETPGVSSLGTGEFTATIDDEGPDSTITYTLTYSGLKAPALFSHIHFGNRADAGGISAFLCGGGSKPPCPPAGGTVTGEIVASDVIGPANQGIAPGAIEELIRAMRAGETYVNVHSTLFPAGEIRGQISDNDQRQP